MSTWSRALGIALLGLVFAPTFPAHGEASLADTEYWNGQDAYMKDSIASANTKCGTKLTFEWINKPVLKAKTAANNWSPNGICSNVFDTLYGVCGSSDDAKRRVAQKIKSVSCGYGDPRTLTLSGTQLTVMTHNNFPVFDTWAKEQLGTKL